MSAQQGGNAPSWLFSFVDLAFLLLIAMTQLAEDPGNPLPDLGEMAVPRIAAPSTESLERGSANRWQLRIHPPNGESTQAFELIRDPEDAGSSERMDAVALQARLSALAEEERRKPLLAPHEDARAQDLLDAVALVEDLWPGRRLTAVSPLRFGGAGG